jgi:hypothetical protein
MSCLFRTKHDALSWAIESANAVDAEIEARRNDRPSAKSLWSGSGRSRGDALQLPKRIKRSKRYEFEAHQVRPPERQFLEHVVRGSRVGYVQEERDAASTLKREPLIDLARPKRSSLHAGLT